VNVLEHAVGRQILVHVRVAELAVAAATARARDTGLGVDHDVAGLDKLACQQRGERYERGRREATGVGDSVHAPQPLGPDIR
jgi:hypothetical protein